MDPTDLFQSTGPAGSDHARSSTHPREAGLVDFPPQRLQTRFAEHKFFTLTETVPAVIFIHRNGRFVYINSAAQEILGYSREEFLRMNFWEVVHPDCRDWVRARGLKRQQGETPPTRYELKALTKSGQPLWLDCSATRIDYQGEPAVLGCCFDITERLQAQEALRESEERFRTLCEAAPIGIAMHDVQGTLLHTNLAYQRMLGYSGEELRQLGLQPITHPDDLAEERRLFVDLRKGKREGHRRDRRYVRKDGRLVWAHSAVSAVRDARGTLRYIISMVEDITDHLKTEKCKTAFSNLGHQLSGASTAEEAARIIAAVALDLLGWDACYLHLQSPNQERLTPVLTIDTVNGRRVDVPPTSFSLEPSPMMRRVAEHGGQLVNRAATEPASVELVRFGDRKRLSASMLYVPIRTATDVIGILSIQSYTPYAYSQEDLETLQALAHHCGEALERINLAKEVLAVSVREQHRIGKDLHDGLGQLLTGVGFLARALEAKLAQQSMPEAAEADQIGQLAMQALAQTRLLAHGLFPVELETQGLAPALEQLAESVRKMFRVSCTVHAAGAIRFQNKTVEENLYRIVQEATNNSIKHGRATRLQIHLHETRDRLVLTVRDNGVGFTAGPTSHQGMGVRIMQYRARSIGAELTARPDAGGGVIVTCALPKPAVPTQGAQHGAREGNTAGENQSPDPPGGRSRDGAFRPHSAHQPTG